eukprot:2745138-Prymnesium_polylepis.1
MRRGGAGAERAVTGVAGACRVGCSRSGAGTLTRERDAVSRARLPKRKVNVAAPTESPTPPRPMPPYKCDP